MKLIEPNQRKKIFVLLHRAFDQATDYEFGFEDFRKAQQQAVGIESLGKCPAVKGLKLMNRLHQQLGDLPPGCPKDEGADTRPARTAIGNKKGPAGGRPKGLLEWTGDQLAQMKKVEALLADMELPWDYADGIAKRMYGASVLRVDTLDAKQLRGVITALTKRQQKQGGRRMPPKEKQIDMFGTSTPG